MSKQKLIITDCDGVLLEWDREFHSWMRTRGFKRVPGTETDYSMAIQYDIPPVLARELVAQFNESEIIANLQPVADSVKYVRKLADHGFRFVVVTSLGNHPDAKKYRTQNLLKVFGPVFNDIHCLEMGKHKDRELLEWEGSGLFWIEDHMRNAEVGHETGLKPILVSRPHNSHYSTDLFPRVSDTMPWEEIYNIVCNEYNIS